MAFTLAFMPKNFSPIPSFKTFQQPRRTIVRSGAPPRPNPSSGKGGKIHREQPTSLNTSRMSVKEQLNEMRKEGKEIDVGKEGKEIDVSRLLGLKLISLPLKWFDSPPVQIQETLFKDLWGF